MRNGEKPERESDGKLFSNLPLSSEKNREILDDKFSDGILKFFFFS